MCCEKDICMFQDFLLNVITTYRPGVEMILDQSYRIIFYANKKVNAPVMQLVEILFRKKSVKKIM